MRNMGMLTACIHMQLALMYICRATTETFHVEYYTNVTLPCNYSAHGLYYRGQSQLVPIRQYWILPSADVIQDSYTGTHKWYVSRPDFSLSVYSVGDDDFGVYFCAMVWNNWDYKVDVIRVGLNEDGPLYDELRRHFVNRLVIGGIIAGSVSFCICICCCCSLIRQRNDSNYQEPKPRVRIANQLANRQRADNLHMQCTYMGTVNGSHTTGGHNKFWQDGANDSWINDTGRHDNAIRGMTTDRSSANNGRHDTIKRTRATERWARNAGHLVAVRSDGDSGNTGRHDNVMRYERNDRWASSPSQHGSTEMNRTTVLLKGNTSRQCNSRRYEATSKWANNTGRNNAVMRHQSTAEWTAGNTSRHGNVGRNDSTNEWSYDSNNDDSIIVQSAKF